MLRMHVLGPLKDIFKLVHLLSIVWVQMEISGIQKQQTYISLTLYLM